MSKLKQIFDELNNKRYCTYTTNQQFLTANNEITNPIEILKIRNNRPLELVKIAYFGTNPTKVQYCGMDSEAMIHRIDELKMPVPQSDNLGELVFKSFKESLRSAKPGKRGQIVLEQDVPQGKEDQFRLIVNKFVRLYSGKNIDAEFYARM